MNCDRNICYQQDYNGGCDTCPCNDDQDAISKKRQEKIIEVRQSFSGGITVTDIIAEVKDKFCRDFCKYAEECEAKLEADEDPRPCPLDRL